MKVKELIEELRRRDPERPVVIGRLELEPADGQRYARDQYPIDMVAEEGGKVVIAFDPDTDAEDDGDASEEASEDDEV
jgi:hypothetical protein